MVLRLGVHPAGIDLIDPDAVLHQTEGEVPGHHRERSLRHRIGGQLRRPTVRRSRSDVDDRPRHPGTEHLPRCGLDEKIGRFHVHREVPIEVFGRVGEQIGSTGRRCHVDNAVWRSESLDARVDELLRGARVDHVRRHEDRGSTDLGELGCERLTSLDRSPGDDEPGGSLLREPAGNGLTEPLGSTIDDRDAHGSLLVPSTATVLTWMTTGSMLRTAISMT